MYRKYFIIFLHCFLLVGCSQLRLGNISSYEAGWFTETGNLTHTNFVEESFPPPYEVLWQFNAGGAFGSGNLLAHGDFLLIGTKKGDLLAVSATKGKKLGTLELGSSVEGSPVIHEQHILVATAGPKKNLLAFNYETGVRKWVKNHKPVQAGLIVWKGLLIVADLRGIVSGIDIGTGDIIWEYQCATKTASIFATPITDEEHLYITDDTGCVASLDALGNELWRNDIQLPIEQTPSLSNGQLIVPTTRGQLISLNTSTGEINWNFDTQDDTIRMSSPAISNDTIYFGATDRTIRSLDINTGKVNWTYEGKGVFISKPLITQDVLLVGGMDKSLTALSLENGQEEWHNLLRGRIKSMPVLYKHTLYVLTEPHHVYALKMSTSDNWANK